MAKLGCLYTVLEMLAEVIPWKCLSSQDSCIVKLHSMGYVFAWKTYV